MKKLGVDIGATNIKAGIVEDGKVLHYITIPTKAANGLRTIKKNILKIIDELIDYSDKDSPIGISSTGDINSQKGTVIYATEAMPSYTGFNLKQFVEDHTKRRTIIANDCIAALKGEHVYGSAFGYENVVMLTLGTGLGGAIMTNGEILFGSKYQACRLGHVSLYQNGYPCQCGKQGCAEVYVSASGLLDTANRLGGNFTDCNEIFNSGDKKLVRKTIDKFTTDFAVLITNYQAIFDPEIFIVGGGLIFTANNWWDIFLKKLDKKCLVKKAKLGNNSGLIGATCMDIGRFK